MNEQDIGRYRCILDAFNEYIRRGTTWIGLEREVREFYFDIVYSPNFDTYFRLENETVGYDSDLSDMSVAAKPIKSPEELFRFLLDQIANDIVLSMPDLSLREKQEIGIKTAEQYICVMPDAERWHRLMMEYYAIDDGLVEWR